ncbi:hypothetical protein, partial [Streptomyces sp. NPDC058254]|uniref:hypothetical protein n=1 Tax=Streptomyces sp. NPDC058254 TaxID=3346406 RepID=UPI0036E241CF
EQHPQLVRHQPLNQIRHALFNEQSSHKKRRLMRALNRVSPPPCRIALDVNSPATSRASSRKRLAWPERSRPAASTTTLTSARAS